MTDLQKKRQWLLGKKRDHAAARRKAADEAHNERVALEEVEKELRELEKDEIKALTDGAH